MSTGEAFSLGLCALTSHRIGRMPDVDEVVRLPDRGIAPGHFNFRDIVTGKPVYNWKCRCGERFMSTGRWSGFIVPRAIPEVDEVSHFRTDF